IRGGAHPVLARRLRAARAVEAGSRVAETRFRARRAVAYTCRVRTCDPARRRCRRAGQSQRRATALIQHIQARAILPQRPFLYRPLMRLCCTLMHETGPPAILYSACSIFISVAHAAAPHTDA